MKIKGTHTINAPRQRVFEMLTDPDALARCIPGARKLSLVGENTYELEINAGVGPIRGSYSGTVRLEDLNPPECYRMIVDAKGKTGFVRGEGSIDLAAEGDGTQVTYSGDVQLGGPVAAVGQRLHLSVSKMMTRQLFGAIEAEAKAAPGETVKHGILRDYLRGKKPGAGE
ncbi:MAG: carbon monoxide dehydrogenase subunit G [Gemmatimonadetes bacterium]|nr:carbon monoxide dehydrogenase subunit G [Gemmatimonadota bacterium]